MCAAAEVPPGLTAYWSSLHSRKCRVECARLRRAPGNDSRFQLAVAQHTDQFDHAKATSELESPVPNTAREVSRGLACIVMVLQHDRARETVALLLECHSQVKVAAICWISRPRFPSAR